MDKTSLGNRMKAYEKRHMAKVLPMTPVVCRIDGKCFHTFTKGLKRPYDTRLSELMVATTKYLVSETNATCGYTQSDEISLVWYSEDFKSEMLFNGRVSKITSVVASMATAYFIKNLEKALPEKADKIPIFDNRVWEMPISDVENYFMWRERDAVKNSISMAAQSVYSHKTLDKKNSAQKQDLLHEKGINWNDYPNFFKRGTYVRKRVVKRAFSQKELESLPEKHNAKTNPDLAIERSVVMEELFPPLGKITNRVDVLLKGADPIEERYKDNVVLAKE